MQVGRGRGLQMHDSVGVVARSGGHDVLHYGNKGRTLRETGSLCCAYDSPKMTWAGSQAWSTASWTYDMKSAWGSWDAWRAATSVSSWLRRSWSRDKRMGPCEMPHLRVSHAFTTVDTPLAWKG